jgi:NarL family two-component system sensor histidine kinase YdfH
VPTPAELRQEVQEEIQRFTLATGIACQAQLEALSLTPNPLCEHVLRAVSEGLTNIARHAQAKHVWVRTICQQGFLVIEIGDDGVGFSPAAVMQTGHYGLIGLRERSRLAQGWLEMSSEPGKGTTLLMSLPLSEKDGAP